MTAETSNGNSVDDRTGAAPVPTGPLSKIDYSEQIPNNVNLAGDRRLQRALEGWQPKFLDWWKTLGPALRKAGLPTIIFGFDHNWSLHPSDAATTPTGQDPAYQYPADILHSCSSPPAATGPRQYSPSTSP